MPLLLAAYASLQDWDAVYGYTFNHRWDEALLGGDQVTGYFDLANEVAKMAQMPSASLIFQKSLVRPAEKLVTVSYDEQRTYDSLKEQRWDRVDFHLDGELFAAVSAGASVSGRAVRRAAYDAGRVARFRGAGRPHRERYG